MKEYINRLITCGFTYDKARSLCLDFLKDFSTQDLDYFISFLEKPYVDKI